MNSHRKIQHIKNQTQYEIFDALYWMREVTLPKIIENLKALIDNAYYEYEKPHNKMLLSTLTNLLEHVAAIDKKIRKDFENFIDRKWEKYRKQSRPFQKILLAQSKLQQQLSTISNEIEKYATCAGRHLREDVANNTSILTDYEMDICVQFLPHESEENHSQPEEKTIANINSRINLTKFKNNNRQAIKLFDTHQDNEISSTSQKFIRELLGESCLRANRLPPLSSKELNKIGEIYVDLIITHQFHFDLEKNQWVKWS